MRLGCANRNAIHEVMNKLKLQSIKGKSVGDSSPGEVDGAEHNSGSS